MKLEVDCPQRLTEWLQAPAPAVFQSQDLLAVSDRMARLPLTGCTFLGCTMTPALATAAAAARALVIPRMDGLPFDPFVAKLYTPDLLFDRFDPDEPDSIRSCKDWAIYTSCMDPETKAVRPVDIDTLLMRRLHDASVADALDDQLDELVPDKGGRAVPRRTRVVAVMGGHDELRSDHGVFADVAHAALSVAQAGYFIVTGGGPGLMEAANLGAYVAGFADPRGTLEGALRELKAAPRYDHPQWLSCAYRVWKGLGVPRDPAASRSFGVPTWFYGHEAPNVFATEIAKYFENSVREEGLLAIALAGVIFARGNAGTVQEIFQDACQNYYRTYRKAKSPMILLDSEYWNPTDPGSQFPGDKRKKAYPLLAQLAAERGFTDCLLLTDDLAQIVPFLDSHRRA
jgi:predicted Rossmann-fold nucleotide-binding protein